MKTVDIADATARLGDYASDIDQEPVVVTKRGRPVAVLIAVPNSDMESVSLSLNPWFMALIERSRAHVKAEGGIPLEEVRRQLAAPRERPRRKARGALP